MLNAGKYSKRITIYKTVIVTDEDGFQTEQKQGNILYSGL